MHCLHGIRSLAPGLSAWSTWCLSQPTHVCWDGATIPCATGVQQGDPCAPALFSAGIHEALEDIARRHPELRQVWYLDDGVLFGPPAVLEAALGRLEHCLSLRGLHLNRMKCELYRGLAADAKQLESLLPHPEDSDAWCYLGVPVAETTTLSSATVRARFDAMISGVTDLSRRYPSQALQLLRVTMGACRVEFFLQALPPSEITKSLSLHCAVGMRQALCAILQVSSLADTAWKQATLPLRCGGLGLRDPTITGAAARTANTINAAEHAISIGASMEYLQAEQQTALAAYMAQLHTEFVPQVGPKRFLQAMLTEPLYEQMQRGLREEASTGDLQRLASLAVPHATAWLAHSPLVSTLNPAEFRAALRWTLGIPLREAPYRCPDCGRAADPKGIHAVCCQRSGAIGRGHTVLRDTLVEILRKAGFDVKLEQSTPGHPERRPADIWISNWLGRPLAIDVTGVTCCRPSAHKTQDQLQVDEAAATKMRQGLDLCREAGWNLLAFVADTFGALRYDARCFVSSVIIKRGYRFAPLTGQEAAKTIWSSLSAAAIFRAAGQLARHAAIDRPLSLPLAGLGALPAPAVHSPYPALHPAPDSLQLLVQMVNGKTLTVRLQRSATVMDLMQIITEREGIPTDQQRLRSAGKLLLPGRTLLDSGVEENSSVHLSLGLRGGSLPDTPQPDRAPPNLVKRTPARSRKPASESHLPHPQPAPRTWDDPLTSHSHTRPAKPGARARATPARRREHSEAEQIQEPPPSPPTGVPTLRTGTIPSLQPSEDNRLPAEAPEGVLSPKRNAEQCTPDTPSREQDRRTCRGPGSPTPAEESARCPAAEEPSPGPGPPAPAEESAHSPATAPAAEEPSPGPGSPAPAEESARCPAAAPAAAEPNPGPGSPEESARCPAAAPAAEEPNPRPGSPAPAEESARSPAAAPAALFKGEERSPCPGPGTPGLSAFRVASELEAALAGL